MLKTWWVKGLLGAILWTALTIGAGIVHTSVILAGRISEAEDAAISEKYGMACGVGVVAIVAVSYMFRSRSTK